MSGKLRIYVSAVASEFAALRLDLVDLLSRLGFEPLFCDVSDSDSKDQRPRLREIIDRCDGLLQIVGEAYGPEPPTIDAKSGRVSYAQFEYLHAEQHKKKTWVILTPPGAAFDLSPLADAESDRAEQGKLQQAFRERLQKTGQVWCEVADETELGLAIERLADERASVRTRFRAWRSIGRRRAAALVVAAAICGVAWLAVRWHNDRVVARELASIDTQRLRAQLEKSIDDSYEREVSSANQLREPPQRRKELANAHRRRHEKRNDVDAALVLVTGTITAGQASPEFLAMSHVLQERGVDAALACLTPYEGQLLERARAEAAKEERGLRRTLSPLLLGIPLFRDRGDLAEAERVSERLLAAEPDWPLAQEQRVVTLMQSGEREFAENRALIAWTRFAAARTSAEQLLKQDPRNRLVQGQLAAAYLRLGNFAYLSIDWKEANELFDMGLALAKQRAAADPLDFEAQRTLLDAYGRTAVLRLGLGHHVEATDVFKEGAQLARTLAAANHEEAFERDLAEWYERVGERFLHAGRARPEAFTASVAIRTKLAMAHPRDVQAQLDLAAAYENRGSVERGVSQFFLQSLEIRKRLTADRPQESTFQHDLAVLYEKMGTFAANEVYRVPLARRTAVIQQAREFYTQNVEIAKQLAAARPADVIAQHDVAVCYEKLVHFCQQFEQNEEACEYGQQQLQILAKIAAADPANADAQRELAAEYNKLGLLRWGAGLLDQARESFQHAFDFYARRAAANPKDESAVSHVDESCANLAGLARSRGDLDTAEKICQHGITLLTQLGVKPPVQPYLRSSAMFAMNSELRGCAETRIIIGPLDALLKKRANQMPGLLYQRAHLLAARRDIDGVAKTADALDALARLEPKQAWKFFYAAGAYGVCAKLASGWPGYGPFPPTKAAGKNAEDVKAHTPTDGQRYARAAIDLLQSAEKAGYKNIRSARSHPDFAALSDVPDFKKLVGGAH